MIHYKRIFAACIYVFFVLLGYIGFIAFLEETVHYIQGDSVSHHDLWIGTIRLFIATAACILMACWYMIKFMEFEIGEEAKDER